AEKHMQGFGFLVPRSEGKQMLACTYVHHKFPHRAPEGSALVRCFIGGQNADAAIEQGDENIVARMRAELREITGLDSQPLFARVYRWRRAMAQYEVGHSSRLARIQSLAASL